MTVTCDIISESCTQTDERGGGGKTEYGIVKGNYSWRLQNVSSANQIKSKIIPDGKKRGTAKHESCTVSSANATRINMF